MQRSLYPDGVVVDITSLSFTELSKAAEILRGRVDWTSRGIFSGGAVTVGAADKTRIDVAAFSGFAPNGEFVECTGNLASIQLDDDTLNAVNYVVAFYTESETYNQPHETENETQATRATGSYRVRVYEESAYNALSASDDNLANDARDRGLILAKVTGNGTGVSLTASNITSPTVYNNLKYSDPSELSTITGVAVTGVSSGTATGVGTIDYTYVAGPTYGLQWTPSAGGAGAVVNPAVDGTYTLTDGTGEYITVSVVISMLPLTAALSENVTIIDLYEQDIPRQTAEDLLHRNMIGNGVLSPENAHALAYSDLSGDNLDLNEHQDLMHSNGITRSSSSSIFTAAITTPVTADLLTIILPAVGDVYYVNGKKFDASSGVSPASWSFESSVIPSATSNYPSNFYEVYVDDEATTHVDLKASFPLGGRNISGTWIVDMSESYPAGTASLGLTVTAGVTTNYAFSWDGGEIVTVTSAMDNQVIRLFAEDTSKWLDLYVNIGTVVAAADGNLPGVGIYSDTITTYASPDWDENMLIFGLPSWWDTAAGPARARPGIPPYSVGTRTVTDKRVWGNLGYPELNTSSLKALHDPQDELHYSGVLYGRRTTGSDFDPYNVVGLVLDYSGGAAYCRGERIDFDGQVGVTLYDNVTNLVYLTSDGDIAVLDVTSDFAGSTSDALQYVIGGNQVCSDSSILQLPERGVALYEVVTSGGAITSTTNIMRNVLEGIDPWSVHDFGTAISSSYRPVSAFDSLYSAFLYAGLQAEGCEINLVGPSYITSSITQPSRVNVRGNTQRSTVVVSSVSATGVWSLSQGCCVRDVDIQQTADTGVTFSVASDCTISRCKYASAVANEDIFALSTSAVSNVVIEGCSISTRSGAVVLRHASNSNIYIKDNIIYQSPNNSALGYALIDLIGSNLQVTGNKVTTDSSIDVTYGIQIGDGSSDYSVDGNRLFVGTGGSTPGVGIRLIDKGGVTDTSASVCFNAIDKASGGGVTDTEMGIYLTGGINILIKDNRIRDLAVGIHAENSVGGSCVMNNASICDNIITNFAHRGISVDLPAGLAIYEIKGLKICGNRLYVGTKSSFGGAVWGTSLYGILLDADLSTTTATLTFDGITICNNDVFQLTSSSGDVYCVYAGSVAAAPDSASLFGLKIDGNNLNAFYGNNGSTSVGIYANFSNMDYSFDNSVSSNCISSVVSGITNPASIVSGLYINIDNAVSYYETDSICISANNIISMKGLSDTIVTDGIRLASAGILCSSNRIFANYRGILNAGPNNSLCSNFIECNGIGILEDTAFLAGSVIDQNTILITTVNSITNSVQAGGSSCGGIVSSSDRLKCLNNKVSLGGSGAPVNVPDDTAMIYATGDEVNICGNQTHLMNVVTTVGGASPAIGHFAAHIYYDAVNSANSSVSHNKIDNFENSGGEAFNGLFLAETSSSTTYVFLHCIGNDIRGMERTLNTTSMPSGPTVYPYEFYNALSGGGAPSVWVHVTSNAITVEDAATSYPNTNWDTISRSQYPIEGSGNSNNFAENYSPAAFW